MKNKDFLAQAKAEFAKNLKQALESKDESKIVECFNTYSDSLAQRLAETAQEFASTADSTILAQRGVRQLTQAEQKFYNGLIAAFNSSEPKQALAGADLTFPETVLDSVTDDIKQAHPLLDVIGFTSLNGNLKWIYSDGSQPLAKWDSITATIAEEVSGSIKKIDLSNSKLTAFLPVPKDILKFGAAYLDAYVRAILSEAIANALEKSAVAGDGNNQPIGMIMDLTKEANGKYTAKTATKLTDFSAENYCSVVKKLTKRTNSEGEKIGSRNVTSVILICNPADYIGKVIPATTIMATDGSYKNNVFPFPTVVIPCEWVDEGKAVIGIAENYKLFLSGSNGGDIDYSDHYQYLEDVRTYTVRLYGTGRPVDNTSFEYVDISKLNPYVLKVQTVTSSTDA